MIIILYLSYVHYNIQQLYEKSYLHKMNYYIKKSSNI